MTTRRFLLYVKAASSGKDMGDCPFSQRAFMFCRLRVLQDELDVVPIDTSNKPSEFLKLNPEGKVPVLVDRNADNKVIPDSGEITKYLSSVKPGTDLKVDYQGPALEAVSGVFPKLGALLKNKDKSKVEALKSDLLSELSKANTYLEGNAKNGKFLLDDQINEIDCMFLPRLRHVIVSGGHYAGVNLDGFEALKRYFENANKSDAFKSTCCPDEEIIIGWSKHTS